jgi:hypothetical protein
LPPQSALSQQPSPDGSADSTRLLDLLAEKLDRPLSYFIDVEIAVAPERDAQRLDRLEQRVEALDGKVDLASGSAADCRSCVDMLDRERENLG